MDKLLTNKILEEINEQCGEDIAILYHDEFSHFGADQSFDEHFPYHILTRPKTTNQVALIIKICNQHTVPLTPRGGGSGVTGGALPVKGGVLISTDRLNKIIELNEIDGYVVAESGVVTAELCSFLEDKGYYFPIIPGSSGQSFIGGNVAENAGSPQSCKYGQTSRYVMNLEVVLPTGEVIWTAANTSKISSGLNITQLFVGSEGTLGVVTKIVYRVMKKPVDEVCLMAGFNDLKDAYHAIIEIKKSGILPSAVELIAKEAIGLTAGFVEDNFPFTEDTIAAQLLVNIQTTATESMEMAVFAINSILEKYTQHEILLGSNSKEREQLWKLRGQIGNAMTANGNNYRDIDICVPLSILYDFILHVRKVSEKMDVGVAIFGHALDGNLHVMLLHHGAESAKERIYNAAKEIYEFAMEHQGVISGEHGIGYLQRDFLPLQLSENQMAIRKKIKKLLDPNSIMNPGKIFV